MRYLNFIMFLAVIVCSCSKGEELVDDDRRVMISVGLESPVSTRAPYELTVPTVQNPLDAEVWASTTSGEFKHIEGANGSVDNYVSLHSDAHFQSGDPQLLSEIIYSKDGTDIHFIGLYPQDAYTVSDDGKYADAVFSGKEDMLFASQVTGEYGLEDNSGNPIWPTLHFYHLLTYISLEVKAESEIIALAWGDVKNISLRSAGGTPLCSSVKILLSSQISKDNNNRYSAPNVSFSIPKEEFSFYRKNSSSEFPGASGYKLKYTEEEVAYVMCAPVQGVAGDPEFYIDITTERRSLTVPVNLMEGENTEYTGSTMGKRFDIQLLFKAGDNIMVSANCNEWMTGGTGSAELDE